MSHTQTYNAPTSRERIGDRILQKLNCVVVPIVRTVCVCVRCSVLQSDVVCCSVLQCVALCCNALQRVVFQNSAEIGLCCGPCCAYCVCVYVAVCCSMLQRVAACCSVVQCVADGKLRCAPHCVYYMCVWGGFG